MDSIVKQTTYLSDVIDLFRNFLMEEKILKNVILQERIAISINIIDVVMKDCNIDVQNNIEYIEPIRINIIAEELTEVIINIINNAKDILLEKKISDPWVKVELETRENKAILSIEDNGGGVPDDIISKIFDSHFTTKGKEHGTGIGLHMSRKIVIDSLKGDLYIENTDNGAKFFIELPLS